MRLKIAVSAVRLRPWAPSALFEVWPQQIVPHPPPPLDCAPVRLDGMGEDPERAAAEAHLDIGDGDALIRRDQKGQRVARVADGDDLRRQFADQLFGLAVLSGVFHEGLKRGRSFVAGCDEPLALGKPLYPGKLQKR